MSSMLAEVTLRIECDRLAADLARAKADLAMANAELLKATADRDRYIARVKLLENRLDAIRGIVR